MDGDPMKLTIQKIKKLIKEELSNLTESPIDPQIEYFIEQLNDNNNVNITVLTTRSGSKVISADVVTKGYDCPVQGYCSDAYVYNFYMGNRPHMTQGIMRSGEYGAPQEVFDGDKGYIPEENEPESALEFLKLISNKAEELR